MQDEVSKSRGLQVRKATEDWRVSKGLKRRPLRTNSYVVPRGGRDTGSSPKASEQELRALGELPSMTGTMGRVGYAHGAIVYQWEGLLHLLSREPVLCFLLASRRLHDFLASLSMQEALTGSPASGAHGPPLPKAREAKPRPSLPLCSTTVTPEEHSLYEGEGRAMGS